MKIVSAHVDSTGAAIARLGDRDRQDAVLEIGGDGVDLDDVGERKGAREAAVAALDAVVLLARDRAAWIGAARAANDDATLFGVDVDLLPRQAWQLRGQDVVVHRFIEINRWRPAWRVGSNQMPELFVEGEQIAQRIPAREGHVSRLARLPAAKPYVLALKGYTAIHMPFLQATRLRKGMLIKVGNDLFRLLELHHLTPGNKRAHIQVRMRNIRTLALADHKFRAEEHVERATLD